VSDGPSCFGSGQTVSIESTAVSTAVSIAADHSTVVRGASDKAILRVMISAKAQQNALKTD
jgi:hypothetical protein